MLSPGTLLQNRYRIHHQLGEGGMGYVYVATDESIASTVAIKEQQAADASADKLRRAFEREAQILANLHHPALPRVTDHFMEGNGQFLVMEYIEGANLSEWLDTHRLIIPGGRGLPYEVVVSWADALLDALEYLHRFEAPVIHRDIKPTNIKVNNRGEVFLLDFGLAKGTVAGQETTTTVYGLTPPYAPLEQFLNIGTDARSDLYALGATLYHLLTGDLPITAADRHKALDEGEPDPLRPAHEVNAAVPEALSQVIAHAMALSRRDRFTSAIEMRQTLRGAQRAVRDEELRRQKEEEERQRQEAEATERRAAEEKRRREEFEELERRRAAEEDRRKQEDEARRKVSGQSAATAAEPVSVAPATGNLPKPQPQVAMAAHQRQTSNAASFRDSADGVYLSEVLKHAEASEQEQPPPSYKLFSPRQIGVATFFGSMIAGGLLLASNYSNLKRPKAARQAVIFSILGFLFLLIGSVWLFSDVSDTSVMRGVNTWLSISITVGFYYMAKNLQGTDFNKHIELGGAKASRWAVVAISLTLMVLLSIVFFAVILVMGPDQSAEANQGVSRANKLVADADRYMQQYNKFESELSQTNADKDGESIQRLASSQVYSLTESARLWREAADMFEQIHRMRVNSKYKNYVSLQAQALRKFAEKIDALRERAETLLPSNILPAEQITIKRIHLLERANKSEFEAMELIRQADKLARDNPTDILPTFQ